MLMFEGLESRTLFSAAAISVPPIHGVQPDATVLPLDTAPVDGPGPLPVLPLPPGGNTPPPVTVPPALPPSGGTLPRSIRQELERIEQQTTHLDAQTKALESNEATLTKQFDAEQNGKGKLSTRVAAETKIVAKVTADNTKIAANDAEVTTLVAQFDALEASAT
jgi:hypothetical protein